MENHNQHLTTLSSNEWSWLKCPPAEAAVILKTFNSVELCVVSETPTLGQLFREHGSEYTEGYLCVWIAHIQDMVGVKNKMNAPQISLCAEMVLNEFKVLKIADLNLLTKQVISGQYGEFYESISIPKVIEWFRKYFDFRCEVGAVNSVTHNQTGQGERKAKDVVQALVEIGVIDQEMIGSIGTWNKEKEDEMQRIKAEYETKKQLK